MRNNMKQIQPLIENAIQTNNIYELYQIVTQIHDLNQKILLPTISKVLVDPVALSHCLFKIAGEVESTPSEEIVDFINNFAELNDLPNDERLNYLKNFHMKASNHNSDAQDDFVTTYEPIKLQEITENINLYPKAFEYQSTVSGEVEHFKSLIMKFFDLVKDGIKHLELLEF